MSRSAVPPRVVILAVPLCFVLLAGCLPFERRRARDPAGEVSAVTPTADMEVSVLPGRVDNTDRWNARVFTQDPLWAHGSDQYAVWVDARGHPMVGRRRLPEGRWSHFDLSAVPGNPLASPTEPDEHNVYVIAVDREGYVHVAGNMHASPLRYVRSVRPGDITQWTSASMIGSEESSVTYPAFVRRRDGSLLFFYRHGGSGYGDVILNAYEDGRWLRRATVIDGRASSESPYIYHVAVDDRDVLHVMFVWRRTGVESTNNDLSYARSPDGGSRWQRADGRSLAVPITHRRSEIVLGAMGAASGFSNAGGLETDSDGRPHAAVLVERGEAPEVWHVWHQQRWRSRPVDLPEEPVSRPSLVVSANGRVYVLMSSRSAIWLVGVAGGAERDRPVVLANGRPGEWELPFDTQDLYRTGAVGFLVPLTTDGVERLGVAQMEPADAA